MSHGGGGEQDEGRPGVSEPARGVVRCVISADEPKDLAVAWLATLGQDMIATIETRLDGTIIPGHEPSPTTGGGRALAGLEALAADIHRVEVGETIGEGGMGIVHGAEQVALGRQVAVKTLKPGKRSASASLDLLREAWVTGSLEHPNIVPVHALELAGDGTPSIVMKRIAGVEWSKLLGDAATVATRFGARDLLAWNLEILMRVLDALRFAHSHGIVHRDLKPANVMIGDFGEVYLLDWGIAVSLRDDGTGRLPLAIHATQLAGTPAYMAPEMLGREDGATISERTDVYLAGAVLHELIAGKPPHAGTHMFAVIASVIASRPELPASAPPELARICGRAMHADPAQRYASVDELQSALRDYLGHRGSEQVATRARERLDELIAKLAEPQPSELDVYRLFGAARYGFRDALAAWPDNEPASRGLTEAVVAIARYELARKRPQAALTLLGELTEPHALVAEARAAAEQELKRLADLEHVHRQHDKRIGTRTRSLLVALFGVAFSVLPLVIWWVPSFHEAEMPLHVMWAVIAMAAIGGAVWWARESIGATKINRRVAATFVFLFFVQGVIAVGGLIAGRTAIEIYSWNLMLYIVVSGMLAITVEPFLWPAVPIYIAAFWIAQAKPEIGLPLSSIPNFILTLLAAWRWKPASIRYTEEERAARRRRGQGPSS